MTLLFLSHELEFSQEALGLKAEVDRTYVTDVENGRRNVSLEILERLIKALEVSFTDFFNSVIGTISSLGIGLVSVFFISFFFLKDKFYQMGYGLNVHLHTDQ